MGILIALFRKTRKGAALLVGAFVATGALAACGSDTEPNPREKEVAARGFTDVTSDVGDTYYGTAGQCRVRIQQSPKEGYVAVQGDTTVPDVSVSLLKTVPQFNHCFAEEPSSSETQSESVNEE